MHSHAQIPASSDMHSQIMAIKARYTHIFGKRSSFSMTDIIEMCMDEWCVVVLSYSIDVISTPSYRIFHTITICHSESMGSNYLFLHISREIDSEINESRLTPDRGTYLGIGVNLLSSTDGPWSRYGDANTANLHYHIYGVTLTGSDWHLMGNVLNNMAINTHVRKLMSENKTKCLCSW